MAQEKNTTSLQEFLQKKGWIIMSAKEITRRQIASTVFREAWILRRRTSGFIHNIGSALRITWKTVRGMLRYTHTKVRGTTFGDRQRLLGRLTTYDSRDIFLDLIREPTNPFDSAAIQIWAQIRGKGSACIGYLSRELAAELAPCMDSGRTAIALLDAVTGGYGNCYGCNFRLLVT